MLKLTEDNKVEITKETTETVDLIQLDTEIAHWQDVINQAQKVIDEKQALRDSITTEFSTLEEAVYSKVEEIKPIEESVVIK
jgi:hypothetical protein